MPAKKLKILVLSPIEPYPPNGGWALVVYNDLVNLRDLGHELYLLANTSNPKAQSKDMECICPTRYFYKLKRPRWWQLVNNVGNPLPFNIARYMNRKLMDAAQEMILRKGIDLVLIEDVAMGTYGSALRESHRVPFFIRGHNIDTQIFRRYLERETNPIVRWLGHWQMRKLVRYEGSVLRSSNGFSMISQSDATELVKVFPELDPAVVGAGTDLEYFQMASGPRLPNLIAHVGSLSAYTKLEAMLWFCRKVLPLIRREIPAVTLQLVGYTPEQAFRKFRGVSVIGRVSDERPYLSRARVFIAPQFVGSGLRLKILNAMATGNAIVCTPLACEGIPLVDGKHAFIRQDEGGFADAVLTLFRDEQLATEVGEKAREMVEKNYNWKTIITRLELLLYNVI